ncbi:MAG TPA: PspC domain-containing protein [Sphingobacteriaceae bacterium]|nr:PspC domain-containing protein [Sphingobacteriaceae bacterium]
MRRLYRSEKDRMLGGVCGGLAEHFGVDPTFIRLAWAVLSLFKGAGVLLYFIAWAIIPPEPKTSH